jgi:predicted AAA+ superfamily ATPase
MPGFFCEKSVSVVGLGICESESTAFELDRIKIQYYICQMYVKRLLDRRFSRALRHFPAVMVTGPRQSGKTTFVTEELKQLAGYVTFDDPFEQGFATEDPNGFLDRFGDKSLILDEIQYVPELLRHIKIRIDQNRAASGRWILTGSQHFELMHGVRETLAGRIAILELFPFSLLELPAALGMTEIQEIIWNGLYPDPALGSDRDLWMQSYVATYLQRDLRDLVEVKDMHLFTTFLSTCAARHAQELNLARIARECGISQPTARRWVGVLEASYIVTLLPPFHTNFGKRLVKSPKLYFVDPGVVSHLTRQPSPAAAVSGAMGGAFFEGLVVGEALKSASTLDRPFEISYWRSHDGLEVDLVISAGRRVVPVEVKLSASPTTKHGASLQRFKHLAGLPESEEGIVVCRVKEPTKLPHNNLALPWSHFPAWLRDRVAAQ